MGTANFFSGASAPPRVVPCRKEKKIAPPHAEKKIGETLKGRLPLEHASDRRETFGKRVSDDLQLFIFRHRNKFLVISFSKKNSGQFFFQETGVLEELGFFKPRWQIRRQKLLPVVRLFWGRIPWRGKNHSICAENLDLAPKMTSTIWCWDWMKNFRH